MNRDTIIRLAEEAGLEPRLWNHTDAFERFAALVAAHEREECAKAIDDSANICAPGSIQTVLREQAKCIRSRT